MLLSSLVGMNCPLTREGKDKDWLERDRGVTAQQKPTRQPFKVELKVLVGLFEDLVADVKRRAHDPQIDIRLLGLVFPSDQVVKPIRIDFITSIGIRFQDLDEVLHGCPEVPSNQKFPKCQDHVSGKLERSELAVCIDKAEGRTGLFDLGLKPKRLKLSITKPAMQQGLPHLKWLVRQKQEGEAWR